MSINVTQLSFPPNVTHTEDGTMCLCCGAMIAHCRNGAWDSDPHHADCNLDETAQPDGWVVVLVCRNPNHVSGGCGWACLVPGWADEELLIEQGCRGCGSPNSVLVDVRGKSVVEAQAAVDTLLAAAFPDRLVPTFDAAGENPPGFKATSP